MPRASRYKTLAGALALWLAVLASPGLAGPVTVTVRDGNGIPVPDVAAFATWPGSDAAPLAARTAIMDQRDTRFVPHILVVQKGTAVEFPNSDVVAHHVYSFSKPNDFVLPLYKGDPHDPVAFRHDGIVTLGCNIHDHMLGYIVVVDTPAFGKTDESGQVVLDVPAGPDAVQLTIWSPRIRDDASGLTRQVSAATGVLEFRLEKRLRPPHDPRTEAVQWSEY